MRKVFVSIGIAGFLTVVVTSAWGGAQFKMSDMMTPAEYSAAGLAKLSPKERAALDTWLTDYSLRLISLATEDTARGLPAPSTQRAQVPSSKPKYTIEVAHNDETFIINGEKFEAQTYCFGWFEGDSVIFLEGSPYGACAAAELLNTRNGKTCKVWCE